MNLPCREVMPLVDAALRRGQNVRLTVTGSSMFPFIRDGAIVELEPLHSSPSVADILLVQRLDGSYAMHRVVRIKGERFFVRGDASLRAEGPLSIRQVLGKAAWLHRSSGARSLDRGPIRILGWWWARSWPLGYLLVRLAHHTELRPAW